MSATRKEQGGRALRAIAAAATLAFALTAAPDGAAQTTLDSRIVPDDATGFRNLQGGAAGEPYVVREDGIGTAQAGRAERRRSLLYLGQLSDFQLADEESPSRVEFIDYGPFGAAWRPWEALNPFIDDAMIRRFNELAGASPVAAADGTRRPMDFAIDTGDSADSQQFNETKWVQTLLDGGALDPGSGTDPTTSADPFCSNPLTAALISDTAAPQNYTGVQDFDDYLEGPTPQFYDPDSPAGPFGDWPLYPGLMDRAQQPFEAAGLTVPSYVSVGNHDGLVQGNAAANASYESVATGCVKPMSPAVTDPQTLGGALAALSPDGLQSLLLTSPQSLTLVPPDPNRRYVSKEQYKQVFIESPQADGHGFGLVDPAELTASNGAASYYAWSPAPGFRFVSLDTVSEAGVVGPSADGNIDDPQYQWLRGVLEDATAKGQLVVLFSHHAIPSLTSTVSDETAPPCTGPDSHGHDTNPGCDVDPRSSEPIHLGADMEHLLFEFPNAIAWIAGHSHVNSVEPHANPSGRGGFWSIRVAAEADWPQQGRLVEFFDNGDGTLSIFGTIVDHASQATAPAPGPAADFDSSQLASVGRTLSYNDTQSGARACDPDPCGEGQADDRNVELLVGVPPDADIGPGAGAGGRCAVAVNGTAKRDKLKGTAGGDRIRGRGGNDRLNGRAGADCVKGGPGNDRLTGGKDRDRLGGGPGADRIKARDRGRDKVKCGPGRDRVKADRKDKIARSCERVSRRAAP